MGLTPMLVTILIDAIVIYLSLAAKRQMREEFYSFIRQIFWPFYRYVKPGHCGILGVYLLWVITGFFIVFFGIMVLAR